MSAGVRKPAVWRPSRISAAFSRSFHVQGGPYGPVGLVDVPAELPLSCIFL